MVLHQNDFLGSVKKSFLKCEKKQESHHETEESHGFRKSEPQNGVGEQLLLQAGIPCVSDDERSKDGSNPSSGSSHSNSGSSGSNELGSGVNVLASYASGQSTGLDGRGNLNRDPWELESQSPGGIGQSVGVHGSDF